MVLTLLAGVLVYTCCCRATFSPPPALTRAPHAYTLSHTQHSEDEPDIVSRRVNAIMEVTPMHLITAYFQHAYEISDAKPALTRAVEEEIQIDVNDCLEDSLKHDGSSSAPPPAPTVMGQHESAADILARVDAMSRDSRRPDPTPSLPAASNTNTEAEDAASVLARVNCWLNPEVTHTISPISMRLISNTRISITPPTTPVSPPMPRMSASITARTDSVSLPPSTTTAASATHGEDAADVLARVNKMMLGLNHQNQELHLPHHTPYHQQQQQRNAAGGKQEDAADVLARVQAMMISGGRDQHTSKSTSTSMQLHVQMSANAVQSHEVEDAGKKT